MFSRYGLRVSLEKTEVMWVGQRKKELHLHPDGKKLKQRESFVYVGGAICGDGNSDTEISRRIRKEMEEMTNKSKRWKGLVIENAVRER